MKMLNIQWNTLRLLIHTAGLSLDDFTSEPIKDRHPIFKDAFTSFQKCASIHYNHQENYTPVEDYFK